MPTALVDHLVIAAATLTEGVAWCEATLGVVPGPGGQHPLMGTHNRLLNISSARYPLCFLEVIAIDPEAAAPGRARWFGFDELDLSAGPRLVNVVARTSALEAHLAALRDAGARPGDALRASRQTAAGLLQWAIAVAPDGRLDGALPTLIQWDDETLHPATRLPASGVTLERLRVQGIGPDVQQALQLAQTECVAASTMNIEAELATPRGPVLLRSADLPTPPRN